VVKQQQAASVAPTVSVVIPTWNSAAFIDECLESVLRQSGPFTLDVVVVGQGSKDDASLASPPHV
jgi:glycosyltransferase involved in cell wall biosynthesis